MLKDFNDWIAANAVMDAKESTEAEQEAALLVIDEIEARTSIIYR